MAIGVVKFGDYRLDGNQFQLSRAGRPLRLEPKPLELLILLAERRGALVSREEIAERLWGQGIFVDTEHGINTAIRKIRYILRDDSEQPRFVQTVMGKGYRFVGAIEEILPSVAKNGYNLPTEEGSAAPLEQASITPDPTSPPFEPPTARTAELRRNGAPPFFLAALRLRPAAAWIPVLLLTLVLLVAGTLFAMRSLRSRTASAEIHSLAVLPLDNFSGDPSQDYFADGMTDDLITMLAKDSTLRVISRTSVMQYKGAHRPIREIAEELGVDGIVEGSVARSGNKLHMTLQLIQGPKDTHVWADRYDRNVDDLVSLPDEAALAIAKKTGSAELKPAQSRYISPAAHDAYLRGKYLWFGDQNEEAGKYFKKAVELQPDYAAAWAGVAGYYAAGEVEGILDPRQALQPAEDAAQKAVDLDPSLPEAHYSLCAALGFRWELAQADRECLRALALDPRFADCYHLRAKLLAALNRHQEAIEQQKKATELDPFARPWALALSYLVARQYEAALADARQRLEAHPHDPVTWAIISSAYRDMGMNAEATQAMEDSLIGFGDQASAAAIRGTFRGGGYDAVLRWKLADLTKQSLTRYVSPVDIAELYAQLGQREQTLGFLEEGYRQHSPQLLWIQTNPVYDFLHSDERYRSLIKQIGLPPVY